jgi:hypothetical protein
LVDDNEPDKPAAKAKGTVKPSDMPMTISRIVSEAVKCFSVWGTVGMMTLKLWQQWLDTSSISARQLIFALDARQVRLPWKWKLRACYDWLKPKQ